ncbi:MAG: hypothetical protein HUU38_08995 [Anaerolineales bacterium]|nr:hypothetical protein [Anaerolineales bacterium]
MKPKYSENQIVINRWSLPPFPPRVRFAVVRVWKQGGDYRYQLEEVDPGPTGEKRTAYADEDVLEAPLLA